MPKKLLERCESTDASSLGLLPRYVCSAPQYSLNVKSCCTVTISSRIAHELTRMANFLSRFPRNPTNETNRISQLNAGQLRLLVEYVQNKVPSLTNKTILDAHRKLLRKAAVETEKRHEEEVRHTGACLCGIFPPGRGVLLSTRYDSTYTRLLLQGYVNFGRFLTTRRRERRHVGLSHLRNNNDNLNSCRNRETAGFEACARSIFSASYRATATRSCGKAAKALGFQASASSSLLTSIVTVARVQARSTSAPVSRQVLH